MSVSVKLSTLSARFLGADTLLMKTLGGATPVSPAEAACRGC